MQIIYNGVHLNVVESDPIEAEVVYSDDGADYLYTRYVIAVTAILSGEAFVDAGADLINNPIANPAVTGALNTAGGTLLGGFNNSIPPPPTLFGVPYPTAPGTVIEPSAQLNPVAANNGIPSTLVTTPTDYTRTQRGIGVVGYERVPSPTNHYGERREVTGPIATQNPAGAYDNVGLSTFGSELPLTQVNTSGQPVEFVSQGHGISASINRQIYRIVKRQISPLTTFAAIRHRLTTPRGQLWVFDGFGDVGAALIVSPLPGFLTDCRNGPNPIRCTFQDTVGTHALPYGGFARVHWICETFINENVENGINNPRTLLSNRFSMTHTLDEDSYLTITVRGKALFRTDWEYRFREQPDLYRPILFLPIPLGFVRSNIQVDGLPDTTGITYSYTDSQQRAHFAAGPYAKASSIHTSYSAALINDTDLLNSAVNAYERSQSLRLNSKWMAQADKEANNPVPNQHGPNPAGPVQNPPPLKIHQPHVP